MVEDENKQPNIYLMKLHDLVIIKQNNIDNTAETYYSVMRVPGGWIYQMWNDNLGCYDKAIFVPFNNEFMKF